MFDWFREVGEELIGINSEAAKKERTEKKQCQKGNCFIFSRNMKILFIICGVLYLFMAAGTVSILRNQNGSFLAVLKYVLLSFLDLFVLFALLFGKQKGEIAALAGSFVFITGLFFSVILA